ncbi:DUF2304 domain-containing protein [Ruania zhangjianzhongii]|uniref:DUF2304 domain-containing protein n=1 Tax=Ruania zhangjianzhongii TaxID=2603206 RepID=UPI00143D2EE5|nr:DUF2304 domain-containing protein [Ruania zhangjianzhongii]
MNEEKIWIQLLLLLGVAVVTVLLTRSTADARHQAVRRVLLALFALATAAAILFPTLLGRAAGLVGVGRGADLVLYLLVIAFLSFIATTYRRMKATDRQITELTRELSLTEARLEQAGLPTAHQAGDGGTHPGHGHAPAAPPQQAQPRPDAAAQPDTPPDTEPDTP